MSAKFVVPEHSIFPIWHTPMSTGAKADYYRYRCSGAELQANGVTQEQAYTSWLEALRAARHAMGGLELAR